MRDALLAATTLAAARGAVAGEVPGALLTLEVSAPLPAGFVVSALPPRFVLLEDGQVFVAGASSVGAGRLDKAEVKADKAQTKADKDKAKADKAKADAAKK